jgi:hypothetical protein
MHLRCQLRVALQSLRAGEELDQLLILQLEQ